MSRWTTWLCCSLFHVQNTASPCLASLWDCKIIRYRQRRLLVWSSHHFHIPQNTTTVTNDLSYIPNKYVKYMLICTISTVLHDIILDIACIFLLYLRRPFCIQPGCVMFHVHHYVTSCYLARLLGFGFVDQRTRFSGRYASDRSISNSTTACGRALKSIITWQMREATSCRKWITRIEFILTTKQREFVSLISFYFSRIAKIQPCLKNVIEIT